MDSKLLKTNGKWLYQQLCILICILVVSGDMLVNMAQWEQMDHWHSVHMELAAVLLVLVSVRLHKMKSAEGWMSVGLLAWIVLTRTFLGDLSVGIRGSVFCAEKMCVVFLAGYLLEDGPRKELLILETALLGFVLSVWSLQAIRVFRNGGYPIPMFDTTIHIREEVSQYGVLRYINFFTIHRNESAAWFLMAMCLLVIQWFACKRKIWRIPIAAVIALLYFTITVQHCRTVYIVTAVGAAMLTMLVVMDMLKMKKDFMRISVAVLAAIIALVVTYKGFDVVNNLATVRFATVTETASQESAVTEDLQPEISEESEGTAAEFAPVERQGVGSESDSTMADNRDLWNDMKTMTARTGIWQSVGIALRNHPQILVFGVPEKEIMNNLHDYGGLTRSVGHTHNMFTQMVMLCGLAGVVLLALFVILLVVKMLLFFFSPAQIQDKILTIPLACILIYGMMEPLFSERIEFTSVLFMFIAGIFLRTYEQHRHTSG